MEFHHGHDQKVVTAQYNSVVLLRGRMVLTSNIKLMWLQVRE
jgi:hypothetical protein